MEKVVKTEEASSQKRRRYDESDDNRKLRHSPKKANNREEAALPWSLTCRNVPDATLHRILWWESTTPPIPYQAEEALIPKLVMYGNKERGMFLKQPAQRLRKLRKLCQQHHVPLPAALSLRRHHIKLRNTSLNMTQLGLGNVKDINASAQVFENAVAECLQRNQVQFYSEAEQRAYSKQHKPPNDKRFPVTPDFILQEPLRIKVFHYDLSLIHI